MSALLILRNLYQLDIFPSTQVKISSIQNRERYVVHEEHQVKIDESLSLISNDGYFLNATKTTEGRVVKYYENGKYRRLNGPAVIWYNEGTLVNGVRIQGSISSEDYYENDKRHKLNGPAVIHYYEGTLVDRVMIQGSISSEEYYENGKRHRLNGPAAIWYKGTLVNGVMIQGSIKSKYYYENGKFIR